MLNGPSSHHSRLFVRSGLRHGQHLLLNESVGVFIVNFCQLLCGSHFLTNAFFVPVASSTPATKSSDALKGLGLDEYMQDEPDEAGSSAETGDTTGASSSVSATAVATAAVPVDASDTFGSLRTPAVEVDPYDPAKPNDYEVHHLTTRPEKSKIM